MTVEICDAIMGTGKTEAAVAYMNEHDTEKFIFVTPYLDEAERIKNSCPKLRFAEPSDKLKQYNFRKSEHTAALIKDARNIATTHQAFKRYTPETLCSIKEIGYILIIDENVDVLETFDFRKDDITAALDAGYIEENGGVYVAGKKCYKGRLFRELVETIKTRNLVCVKDGTKREMFYWTLTPELLRAFKKVFILTYMFKGQSLCRLMEFNKIPYKYIGVRKEKGKFMFCETDKAYTPEYVSHLKEKVHIVDNGKINLVGWDYYALSAAWFDKNEEGVTELRRNMQNCVNGIWKGVPAKQKLWATFSDKYGRLRGAGYSSSFLVFNARATNAYSDRTHLIYAINIFMNVGEKLFYKRNKIEADEDAYALSTMVQWIWRSAIRRGEDIYVYIPSNRMRTLLECWLEAVSCGFGYEKGLRDAKKILSENLKLEARRYAKRKGNKKAQSLAPIIRK